jgi:hypothetical protein
MGILKYAVIFDFLKMKSRFVLLLFFCLCLGAVNSLAQFHVLFNFEMLKNGASPTAPLILSGDKLYGELQNCEGKDVVSCVYSIDTNGTNYKN